MADRQLHQSRAILNTALNSARYAFGRDAEETFIPLRCKGELHLALARNARRLKHALRNMPPDMSKGDAIRNLTDYELQGEAEELNRSFGPTISEEEFKRFLSDRYLDHLWAAQQHLVLAERVRLTAGEPYHRSLIKTYTLLAKVSLGLGHIYEATDYYHKAADVRERSAA